MDRLEKLRVQEAELLEQLQAEDRRRQLQTNRCQELRARCNELRAEKVELLSKIGLLVEEVLHLGQQMVQIIEAPLREEGVD